MLARLRELPTMVDASSSAVVAVLLASLTLSSEPESDSGVVGSESVLEASRDWDFTELERGGGDEERKRFLSVVAFVLRVLFSVCTRSATAFVVSGFFLPESRTSLTSRCAFEF